jgi:O-antigen/teichoic acid export membrane protein
LANLAAIRQDVPAVTTTTTNRRLPALTDKFTFFITTFGVQGLRIVSTMIMARLVSKEDYGLLTFVTAIPAVISDLGDLGVTRGLMQIRDEPLEILEDVGLVLTATIYLVYLALGICGGFYLAHKFSDRRLIPLGCITGVTLYMSAIYNYQLTILNRAMRFRAESFQNIIYAIALCLTGISLAWVGLGVFALALQPFAAQVIANITMHRHYKFRWPSHFQLRVVRKMVSYGGRVTVAQYASNVRDTFINLVVGYGAGPGNLGIFGRAGQVKDLFGHNIVVSIDRMLNPTMTAAREDPERLRSLFVRGVVLLCLVCWLGWAGFSVNAHNLILVMWGHKWVAVAPLLVVMSLDLLTTPFVISSVLLTHTLGLPMLWLRFTLVSAVLLIPCVLVAAHYGKAHGPDAMMWWIAMATIIAYAWVGLAFFAWSCRRLHVDTRDLLRRLSPIAAAAVLSFVAMFVVNYYLSPIHLLALVALVLCSSVGCAVYAGIIWFMDPRTVSELKQLAFERKGPVADPADLCATIGYDVSNSTAKGPGCGHELK